MDFLGLIGSYPKQRPITELERDRQLYQERRLNVDPHYQLSVIRMNSGYLESVDKWFGWKGLLSAVMLAIISIFMSGFLAIVYATLTGPPNFRPQNDGWFIVAVISVMISPVVGGASWILKKESFAYTHYPIRFNRKRRMVHVFRTDGTVLSAHWDQVFFTLGHMKQWNQWEVRGHVLESDKITIRETFALSYVGSLNATDVVPGNTQYSSEDYVRAHWEFIRRYMEEGPQAVSSQVQFCMPVNGRRESFRVGMERVFANFAGAPFLIYWLMFPFCLIISIFRWLAMRTSKIPQWPEEVEASCRVEPDDPYAIEGASDGERVAVFPQATVAAGVRFCSLPSDGTALGGTVSRT